MNIDKAINIAVQILAYLCIVRLFGHQQWPLTLISPPSLLKPPDSAQRSNVPTRTMSLKAIQANVCVRSYMSMSNDQERHLGIKLLLRPCNT